LPSKRITAKIVLPLIAGTALIAATSTTIIGMASSQNNLTLDNSRVSGNATLFDGSTVEASGYSRIQLKNGTRIDLGAGSQAKIFANHASLDRGMSEIQSASGFEVGANSLKIRTTGADGIARIKLDNKAVMVTALNAPVEVLNPAGLLIARVAPGLPLSFMPQGGSMTSFDSTGCVLQKSGAAIIVGDGNQVYELRGADLRKIVGNKAHVTGSVDSSATPAGGATQVIKVSTVSISSKGGCSSVATTVGASTAAAGLGAAASAGAAGAGAAAAAGGAAAAGAAAAGISTTALVVGGVAAATAASVGGAAAAGAFSSTSP
jgi:hypothetical protein